MMVIGIHSVQWVSWTFLILSHRLYLTLAASTSYTVSSTSSGTFVPSGPSNTGGCCTHPTDPLLPCTDTCYNNYDNDYTLTATAGHRAVLVVQTTSSCDTGDYFRVYEASSSGTLLASGCAGYTGFLVTTTSNVIVVLVHKQTHNRVSLYIKFRYFGVDPEGNPDPSQTIFSTQTHTPLLPNTFPAQYTASTSRWWILKAPCQSYKIIGALFFSDFHNCNDQLYLRNGRTASSSVLKSYCTSLTSDPDTGTFTSTQQYVYVQMSITSGGTGYGFALKYYWAENTAFTYTTPISTCSSAGIQITAYCPFTDMVLQSPNFGSTYNGNQQCEYIISGDDDGYRVKLEFTAFEVENETYCVYDRLSVFDGSTASEPLRLNTFCGSDTPPIIYSASQYIRLVFKTDYTLEYTGFRISYSSINSTNPECYSDFSAGKLTATDTAQYISSQNYPNNYTSNLDEYWWITNPNHGSNDLVLEITDGIIEEATDCKYDKLMIYEGPCTTYPLVATHCGEGKPRYELTASADYLVRFHTDYNSENKGFRLKYLYETTVTTIEPTTTVTTQGPPYDRLVEMMLNLVTNFTVSDYWSDNLAMKYLPVASPSTIDFYLTRLQHVDEEAGTFQVSGYFSVTWLDEFIVWEPEKKDKVQQMYVALEDVWKPDLVHVNSVNGSAELGYPSMYVVIAHNGTVTWRPHVVLTSTCNINLAYYPTDEHTCHIKMRTWSVTTSNLAMVQGADRFGRDSRWADYGEWSVIDLSSSDDNITDPASGFTHTTFSYSIRFKRNANFQVFHHIIPFIIMGGLNILALLIPQRTNGKATFNMISFLLIFVHLLLVIGDLPGNSESFSTFSIYTLCVVANSAVLVCISTYLIRIAHRNVEEIMIGPKLRAFTKVIWRFRKTCSCKALQFTESRDHEMNWEDVVGNIEIIVFIWSMCVYVIFTVVMMIKVFVVTQLW